MDEQPTPVPDEARLWRRIIPAWITDGGISSAAFRDGRSGEVSVFLADMTSKAAMLDGWEGARLVEITAAELRSFGCEVFHDKPLTNPSHAYFVSPKKSVARQIRDAVRFVD